MNVSHHIWSSISDAEYWRFLFLSWIYNLTNIRIVGDLGHQDSRDTMSHRGISVHCFYKCSSLLIAIVLQIFSSRLICVWWIFGSFPPWWAQRSQETDQFEYQYDSLLEVVVAIYPLNLRDTYIFFFHPGIPTQLCPKLGLKIYINNINLIK